MPGNSSSDANGHAVENRHTIEPTFGHRWIRALGSRWSWIAIVLLVLLAAPLVYVQYSVARIPDIGSPVDIDSLRARSIEPGKNAFVDYAEAGRSFQSLNDQFRNEPKRLTAADESMEVALDNGWEAANADVRQWVKENEAALLTWRRGTDRDEGIEVPYDRLTINSLLPETQLSRDFARLALLEASRLTEEGKVDEAWGWIRATLRASRHVGMHATIIGRLVGAAILSVCDKPIQRWAARPEVTADDLRRALNDLQTIAVMTPPPSEVLKIEYLMLRQTPVEELHELEAPHSQWLFRIMGIAEQSRRLDNHFFANWLQYCDKPRFERPEKEQWGLFEQTGAASPATQAQPQEIMGWLSDARSMASMVGIQFISFTPAAEQSLRAVDREVMRLEGLRLSLILQLYYREHGEFPESLEVLRGKYLKEIPADPFGKGEPLRYRREPGSSSGAMVWSLGEDGIDQDGRVEQTQEGPKLSEFDEVFHILRPEPAKSGSREAAPIAPVPFD